MSRLLALPVCLMLFTARTQNRNQLWIAAGIKREITKDIVLGIQTNLRTSNTAVQTLFQEVSLKSEHLKWFRPSVDYRFITAYANNRNTTFSNRINFNADFKYKFRDYKLGLRGRYQLFLGNGALTGTDLDPSIRIKPYVEWTIPKTRFTPEFSTEFFYNPTNSPTGDRFNRIRFGLSLGIDLPGPNELGITYYYGKRFNNDNPYTENILSLEYLFEWRKNKESTGKKKTPREPSDRYL